MEIATGTAVSYSKGLRLVGIAEELPGIVSHWIGDRRRCGQAHVWLQECVDHVSLGLVQRRCRHRA